MCYLLLIVFIIIASCSNLNNEGWKQDVADPQRLHRSIGQVTDVIVYDIFSPPVASRIYAYVSVAAYEAVAAGDSNYVTMAGQLHGLNPLPKPEQGMDYCFELAAVEAALKVGRALVFSENRMDNFYAVIMNEFKSTGMPRAVFKRSVVFGDQVADHIMAWANADNYKQTRSYPKYTIQNDPSTWKPTPPAYMDAIEPHWNSLRTFFIDSAAQFKPESPTPFSTQKESAFHKEALETYSVGKSLVEGQKEIAAFWDCNPFVVNVKGHVMFATKRISPGGHWINITRVACQNTKADFAQSAEGYMLVAVSIADAFISCWDEKYRSKLIRPETYINQYIEEAWAPLLQTPPFPEYPSGHSVISSAAAVTLTRVFGEPFPFTDSTEIKYRIGARNFTSFIQASEEAAISRLYGGIHFRPAIEEGVKQGRSIGGYCMQKLKTRKQKLGSQSKSDMNQL